MLRTTIHTLFLFMLAAPLCADKFHFDTPAENDKTQGNAVGRVVEGVLVKQDSKTYTIRFVGGEMQVQKSAVTKIEKDGLTVAKIEDAEKNMQETLASANTRRREIQAAEASARRAARKSGTGQGLPESKSLVIEIDFQGLLPGYTFRTYDPVLDRANLNGLQRVIENYLRTEVRKAARR